MSEYCEVCVNRQSKRALDVCMWADGVSTRMKQRLFFSVYVVADNEELVVKSTLTWAQLVILSMCVWVGEWVRGKRVFVGLRVE